MILTTYIDESGTHDQSHIIVMAGYVVLGREPAFPNGDAPIFKNEDFRKRGFLSDFRCIDGPKLPFCGNLRTSCSAPHGANILLEDM